jgi:uncharacterized protein (TIGR03435 family)
MMKRMMGCVALLMATVFGMGAQAQDVTGQWQGTLHAGSNDLRIILKIAKEDGKLGATMYSIDQGGQPFKATGVGMDGATLRLNIDVISGKFEGKLSGDGKTIAGTWTQGPSPLPLVLAKSTAETAWEIPAPPAPPKLMAADADPAFDVATIKPNPSGENNLRQLTMNGRSFKIRNGSLDDLLTFAYNVQVRQIVGGPEWISSDRYDIDAVPDKEGEPSVEQMRVMMRKLLAERFALKFHSEKREMEAFVLGIGKGGEKLSATQGNGTLPGFGMGKGKGGVRLNIGNATMDEFASFLQMQVVDLPVVNRTALTARYDFNVTFVPDDSMFHGHAPKIPEDEASAPSLLDAVQLLGLKLSAEKTAVGVIVVDHVEKPSAN